MFKETIIIDRKQFKMCFWIIWFEWWWSNKYIRIEESVRLKWNNIRWKMERSNKRGWYKWWWGSELWRVFNYDEIIIMNFDRNEWADV